MQKENNKLIIKLCLYSLFLFCTWYYFKEIILGSNNQIDRWLTLSFAKISLATLNLFDLKLVFHAFKTGKTGIFEGRQLLLYIDHPCNGLSLFALFSGFILIFPGPLKIKCWFLPLGILVIAVANYIRIMLLIVVMKVSPDLVDFNHKYTFTFLVYALIFGLWVFWANRFGIPSLKEEKSK